VHAWKKHFVSHVPHVPNVLNAQHLESFDPWLDGLIACPAKLFDATSGQATASSLCCACPSRFCSCNILLARLILPANMARHAIPERPTHRLTCMIGLRIQPAAKRLLTYLAGSRVSSHPSCTHCLLTRATFADLAWALQRLTRNLSKVRNYLKLSLISGQVLKSTLHSRALQKIVDA
jgi:hypothetical protein